MRGNVLVLNVREGEEDVARVVGRQPVQVEVGRIEAGPPEAVILFFSRQGWAGVLHAQPERRETPLWASG